MYQFSSKLKTFSFILMVVGALGIGYGFLTTPKTTEDVEKILKEQEAHHGGGHHEAHATAEHGSTAHAEESHANADASATTISHEVKDTLTSKLHASEAHTSVDSTTVAHDSSVVAIAPVVSNDDSNHNEVVVTKAKEIAVDHAAEHKEHVEHVKHQLQNKPWSALYVACIFFMLIAVGALAFYAIQWAAQAGWSPIVFRVMEGVSSYLLPGSIIFFVLLLMAAFHVNNNHIFVWMDEEVVKNDHLIQGKSGFLNVPFFLIRAAIFLIGWNLYRFISRKNSIKLDETKDLSFFKKNYKAAATFLVFFIVSESIMSWDWIMSVDPHWYSTLFGWYVFASFFVSGITVITLITLYLKSKGLLPQVNKSHIHDLAKFMFGISIFWTYLWFSQFMLMWYSDIPEEITYFITRIENYNLPFFGMVAMNFLFPLLILMNADFKRLTWVIVMAGIVILAGHYLDFYNMIMPATVGDQWFIGVSEISSVLFFLGLFIFVVFTSLTKTSLVSEGNPYIEESKHFHY
ncbi:quinol:cytochrome C oxidoreductase [Flavobacterium indicum]|nr:quinol:cytochrome C oxidoreductase [Flavobacterium indicum]